MNKRDLIEHGAKAANVSQRAAAELLDAFLDGIQDALKAGDEVRLPGFGSFKVSERAARTGRNPQTGEEVEIAARKVPKFTAGKGLKDSVQ